MGFGPCFVVPGTVSVATSLSGEMQICNVTVRIGKTIRVEFNSTDCLRKGLIECHVHYLLRLVNSIVILPYYIEFKLFTNRPALVKSQGYQKIATLILLYSKLKKKKRATAQNSSCTPPPSFYATYICSSPNQPNTARVQSILPTSK